MTLRITESQVAREPAPELPIVLSTSPEQAVAEVAVGVWRARCAVCAACSDAGVDDAAWLWVDDHLCGVETIRLPAS